MPEDQCCRDGSLSCFCLSPASTSLCLALVTVPAWQTGIRTRRSGLHQAWQASDGRPEDCYALDVTKKPLACSNSSPATREPQHHCQRDQYTTETILCILERLPSPISAGFYVVQRQGDGSFCVPLYSTCKALRKPWKSWCVRGLKPDLPYRKAAMFHESCGKGNPVAETELRKIPGRTPWRQPFTPEYVLFLQPR